RQFPLCRFAGRCTRPPRFLSLHVALVSFLRSNMMRAKQLPLLLGAGLLGVLVWDSPARAGVITLVLSARAGGAPAPPSSGAPQFSAPSGSPRVAVTQIPGGTLEAVTAGGTTFFDQLGTPVTLAVADGSAYLASSGAPGAARPSDGLSSAAPVAGKAADG